MLLATYIEFMGFKSWGVRAERTGMEGCLQAQGRGREGREGLYDSLPALQCQFHGAGGRARLSTQLGPTACGGGGGGGASPGMDRGARDLSLHLAVAAPVNSACWISS